MRVGAGRSSPRVLFSGNANPGGWDERRVEGERRWQCGFNPRRRTQYALGLALGMERRFGGGERRSSPKVYIAGTRNLGTAMRGNERGERRGTQSGQWLRRQTPHRWKLRCNGRRPVCCCRATGARGSCGAAACVQQLRRSHGEAAGACCTLQPQSAGSAKQVQPLRQCYRRVRVEGPGSPVRVWGHLLSVGLP